MTSVILTSPLLIVLAVVFLLSFELPLFLKVIPDVFSLISFLFLTAFLIFCFVSSVPLSEMVIAILSLALILFISVWIRRKAVKP